METGLFFLEDTSGELVRVEVHTLDNGRRHLLIGHGDADLTVLGEDEAVKLAQRIMAW